MVADEILGGLRPSWERRNFAWTCDAVSLSCLGYAVDVLLFSGSKASLETMIEDCCTNFGGEAGLEVGLRLRRTNASGKLVKAHFSPHVADFVWSRGSSDLFGFFYSSVGLQLQSRVMCVGEAGPRLLSGHALFT